MKALALTLLALVLVHRYISQPGKPALIGVGLEDCADEWPVHDGRSA